MEKIVRYVSKRLVVFMLAILAGIGQDVQAQGNEGTISKPAKVTTTLQSQSKESITGGYVAHANTAASASAYAVASKVPATVAPTTGGIARAAWFAVAWGTIVVWITCILRFCAPRLLPYLWHVLTQVSYWVLQSATVGAILYGVAVGWQRLFGGLPGWLRQYA